ncbi:MAG TPA: putative lipid II flippase FtsW, partial [Planctomycetota bacterium]|nr:putative lipid II flippase FtsW [Planctomycetota bacterium]
MRWRRLSFGVRLPSWIARGGLSVRGGAASIRSRFGRVWPARAAEPDTRRWRAWSGFLPALRAEDVLLASVTFLLAISTVMIYSAGAFYHHLDGDSFHFLKRQILWLPIAILVGILFSSIDYRHYRRYYPWILALSVLLLALVLVPAVGRVVNNSRRWLSLGPRLQFQPSELAKLATVLFVSGFLANQPERSRRFLTGFLPLCLAVFLVFGLIILEPDLGSSVFVLGLAVGLMLIAGVRLWYLLPGVFAIAPVLAFYVHDHWETVERRLLGFLRPEDPEQHQVYHSLIALGSGSWFGVGLGGSTEKLRYLPEAHTDFIFSIIGEELGFTGCMAILLLFLALVWAGVTIAWRARDRFGFLVASGITMALGYQAAINVAVVTGSAPTKGMSLPLLSFGGSGLCVTLAQIGILLSIARVARTEPRPAELELGGSRSKRPARKSRRAKKASRKATRPRRPARPSRARRKETAPAMVTADGGSARSEPKSGAAREAADPNASKGDAQETTPAVERAPWESPHAF